MTEYMYAFTTNATKIVPQSRSPRIQRSSNITKIYHQIFHRHGHLPYLLLLGSFYYYLFKLFFTNTFSLFTFFFNYFHLYHRLFSFVQANHPSTFSPGNNYEHEAFGDITGTSQTINFLFFHFYFFYLTFFIF